MRTGGLVTLIVCITMKKIVLYWIQILADGMRLYVKVTYWISRSIHGYVNIVSSGIDPPIVNMTRIIYSGRIQTAYQPQHCKEDIQNIDIHDTINHLPDLLYLEHCITFYK